MENRVIKFRVLDRRTNNIVYLEDKYMSEALYYSKNRGDVLMQFTGLLDKNGKEIYEGDIATVEFTPSVPNYIGNSPNTYTQICEVVFHNGGFKFKNMSKGKGMRAWPFKSLVDNDLTDIKIIGNVFDHPELLNPPSGTKKEG